MVGRRGRQVALWTAGGLGLFVYGFAVNLSNGVNYADESWFLQVVTRVHNGEVLYRDVFIGVTPLSVYITGLFVTVFGDEMLIVKIIVALCFTLTILVTCHIAKQLAPHRSFPLLLALALIVYAPPYPHAVYQPLAQVFFLGTFAFAVAWVKREPLNPADNRITLICALGAGVIAGLCFATKQNIGGYAFVAFLLTVAASRVAAPQKTSRLLGSTSISALGFGAVVSAIFATIYLSGGINRFIDYGFLNKTTYLNAAAVSYAGQLERLAGLLFPPLWVRFDEFYSSAHFILPPLALVALAIAVLRVDKEGRELVLTVLIFFGAAFLGVFPRVDHDHFVYAVPQIFLGISLVYDRIKPFLSRHSATAVSVVISAWLAFGLFEQVSKIAALKTPAFQLATLPHFYRIPIGTDQYNKIRLYARALAEQSLGGNSLFLLLPEAGFYYLVSGLDNPTAFDYPLVTAFGLNGDREVANSIARKEIRAVCLRSYAEPALRPVFLEEYVQRNLQRGEDIGLCTFYHVKEAG